MKMVSSLFLMFLIIIAIIIYVGRLVMKMAMKRNPNLPPGPLGLPFIGNFLQFHSTNPHKFLWKLSKKYGPLMSLKLGSMPILVISSAKMAKIAFKNHDQVFSGRRPSFGQVKLSYNSLDVAFVPYGDYWREMRKVFVLHLFSSKMVQSFRTIREDEILSLITKVKSLSSSSSFSLSSSSSDHHHKLVNLSSLSLAFTSTLICRIAFGKNFDNNSTYYKKRFDAILLESQAMMGSFFMADIFPWLSWVDHLSGKIFRLNKNFRELDLFYQELIQEHLNSMKQKKKINSNNDVLDLLIQLKQEQNSSSTVNFTWDHVKALLMDIFIGGTDTSAAAIVWTMTALMKNPTKLKKLQAEIRDFAGNRSRGLIINEEEIQLLTYLKAVVKEAMRMYPPVPLLIPRETSQQCIIEGYKIEPKTVVYINAWAIGRDPECWDHNPEEFLPERFLLSYDNHDHDYCDNHDQCDYRTIYNKNNNNNFGLIPFGAGRRGCPGISLALATVELAVANLVYSFDWELPNGMKLEDIDTKASPGITMHKKHALCLVPKQYTCTN